MANEVLSLNVTISLTTTMIIADEDMAFSVSIQFRMSLYLYRNIDSYETYERKIPVKEENKIKDYETALNYIMSNQAKLKECYVKWNDHLLKEQKRVETANINSIEELVSDIEGVAKKSVDFAKTIQAVIVAVNEEMEKYEKEAKDNVDTRVLNMYFLFLSNACQAIRDLGTTFEIQDPEKVSYLRFYSPVPVSVQKIVDEWIKKYPNAEVLSMVQLREQLSESIDMNLKKLTDAEITILDKTGKEKTACQKEIDHIQERIAVLSESYEKIMEVWPDPGAEESVIKAACEKATVIEKKRSAEMKEKTKAFESKLNDSSKSMKDELESSMKETREFITKISSELDKLYKQATADYREVEEAKYGGMTPEKYNEFVRICKTSGTNLHQGMEKNAKEKMVAFASKLVNGFQCQIMFADKKLGEITSDPKRSCLAPLIIWAMKCWSDDYNRYAKKVGTKEDVIADTLKKWDKYLNKNKNIVELACQYLRSELEELMQEGKEQQEQLQGLIADCQKEKESLGFFKFSRKSQLTAKIAELSEKCNAITEDVNSLQKDIDSLGLDVTPPQRIYMAEYNVVWKG